jgi:hypothetical protein
MVLPNVLHELSNLNLLGTLVALNLPFGAVLSVLVYLRDFVLRSTIVLADHLLHADHSLGKLVEHNVDVWSPAGWACFLVVLDLESAQVAKQLAAAAAAKRLEW